MTSTDHFHDAVDRLDTGLPDEPDLAGLRGTGSRIRRRRRIGQTVGAGAAVALLAVPLLGFLGGAEAPAGRTPPVTGSPAAPAPVVESAGPGFGPAMRSAVADAFPGADYTDELLGDRWVWRDAVNLDWEVGDPPRWATLFAWAQYYELDGTPLSVVAQRESPSPVIDPASYGYCRDGLFAVERDCRVWEVDGRTIVLHDGTQARGQDSDNWVRTVDVYGAEGTDSMQAHASVSVVGTGDTWAEARAGMPDVASLTALALDERLVLPEPERYPTEFPPNRPRS